MLVEHPVSFLDLPLLYLSRLQTPCYSSGETLPHPKVQVSVSYLQRDFEGALVARGMQRARSQSRLFLVDLGGREYFGLPDPSAILLAGIGDRIGNPPKSKNII